MSEQSNVSAGTAKPVGQPRYNLQPCDTIYRYDGTFAGFLCCVFTAFSRHELPLDVWPEAAASPTMYTVLQVDTDEAHARRVFRGYCGITGDAGRRLLHTAFLAEEPDRDICLLRFIHLVFCEGKPVLSMLGHPLVAPVYKLERAVNSEAESLKGFVRFQDADGMLGAVIHPKHRVLPLLSGYFRARMPSESYLIYDATHCEVLAHSPAGNEIIPLEAPLTLPLLTETEKRCQALWKQFYNTLCIEARRNEKLRRQHMPKRYWQDLPEMRQNG